MKNDPKECFKCGCRAETHPIPTCKEFVSYQEEAVGAAFKKALEKLDWGGMAWAWAEGNIGWHAEEWKNFIEAQREEGSRAAYMKVREEIEKVRTDAHCKMHVPCPVCVLAVKDAILASLPLSAKEE